MVPSLKSVPTPECLHLIDSFYIQRRWYILDLHFEMSCFIHALEQFKSDHVKSINYDLLCNWHFISSTTQKQDAIKGNPGTSIQGKKCTGKTEVTTQMMMKFCSRGTKLADVIQPAREGPAR